MYYINLNDLKFKASHGVLPEEKTTPQDFTIHIKIETDQVVTAAQTDNIDDTLNYVTVYELTRKIMLQEQYNLIETIAMQIATRICELDDHIISAHVHVIKENPPIADFQGSVSTEYIAYNSGAEEDRDFSDFLLDEFFNEDDITTIKNKESN